jgi:site-specific recombinase XerD
MKEAKKHPSTVLVAANGSGETVTISAMLEMLEAAPNKEEVMNALRALRGDKVKAALGRTLKAAAFDRGGAVADFLIYGEKAERTRATYKRMLEVLFRYLDTQGLPVLAIGRADVNRYIRWLKGRKLAVNSVRLAVAAAATFWRYLEATEVVQTNPWAGLALPRREYKKAIRREGEKTIPVMNPEESKAIIAELRSRANTRAVQNVGERRAKDSARTMLPVAMLLAETGVRIGDAMTLRREGEGRVSFTVKGGRSRSMTISADLEKAIPAGRRPFQGMRAPTITMALHKITVKLCKTGRLRHAYTPHDFRHMKAVELYRNSRDVLAVQRELGHASLSATQTYLAGIGAVGE